MLPSEYEIELLAKERVREGLRKAEQHRLIREARGARKPQRWWWLGAMALKRLLATLGARRVDEPRRRSSSTAPGRGRQSCAQELCEA